MPAVAKGIFQASLEISMKDCKKGKEQVKMGSLPEIQLSADTGEGTGGREEEQRMTIEFHIIFFLCLHLIPLCLCMQGKVSGNDTIQVPTPTLHAALPRSLNAMISQTSGIRYKS